MDKPFEKSVFETLEEAYISPYSMTTQVCKLEKETILYNCHVTNLDNISIRIFDYELIYTNGKYDVIQTGIILGRSFSEIQNGLELNIDNDIMEAIDRSVLKFYNKYKSLERYTYKK